MRKSIIYFCSILLGTMILFCNGCASNTSSNRREKARQRTSRQKDKYRENNNATKRNGKDIMSSTTDAKSKRESIKIQLPSIKNHYGDTIKKRFINIELPNKNEQFAGDKILLRNGQPAKGIKLLKMKDGTIIESGKSLREIIFAVEPNKIKECHIVDFRGDSSVPDNKYSLRCYWIRVSFRTDNDVCTMYLAYPIEKLIPTEEELRQALIGWTPSGIYNIKINGKLDKFLFYTGASNKIDSLCVKKTINYKDVICSSPLVAISFYRPGVGSDDIIAKYKNDFPGAMETDRFLQNGLGMLHIVESNDARCNVIMSTDGSGGEYLGGKITVIDKEIEKDYYRADEWQKEVQRQDSILKNESDKIKKKEMDF